jgi:hypothetical protein
MKNDIELTAEDWQRADEYLARDVDLRAILRERVARSEAQKRIAREQEERRRRVLNRFSFGLLARR